MITFRAGTIALIALLASLAAACSREQQDWRAAEGADTSEAWQRFIEQHPASELAPQARARLAQLAEQRDWQHATGVGTVEAYREFLSQHGHGRWSEEARIRIEAFSLGSAPRTGPPAAAAAPLPAGVPALQIASAAAPRAPAAPQPAAPAPQSSAATAPPAAPAPGGYGVQLGAFGSEASADREWQRLQGRFGPQLGGLSPRIVLSSTSSGELYRLEAPAAGEAQARALCESLKEQSQACVPVLPVRE